MRLMSVEAARQAMLAALPPPRIEATPIAAALGRVLAQDVVAGRDQPPFAASAMDGWAARGADGLGPRRIVGESAAGHPFHRPLEPGEAVRIFTGAAVPPGADLIVIQEEARRDGDLVHFERIELGAYIRPAALDFSAGDRLLAAPVALDPWRIALAAAAGRAGLPTYASPRVAVVSTGEEIVAPGGAPGPFQIFDCGAASIGAVARQAGARLAPAGRAGDSEDAIIAAVSEAQADLVITLGGASVGDHDLVKPALDRLGLQMVVESVAVRPGKPTWFGRLGDGRLVLGLPGNPASAMVCAELFLVPLLRTWQGLPPGPELRRARLAADLPPGGAREHWMRAFLSEDESGARVVAPMSDQDSSLVGVFARADALLRRVAQAPAAKAGDTAQVLPLARLS